MKPLIITDSNCDLSIDYIKENNIHVIPFYFDLNGKNYEDAEYLKKLVMSEVKVRNVIINCVGPIIGTHTGPGIICIAFIGESRKE